MLMYRIICKIV